MTNHLFRETVKGVAWRMLPATVSLAVIGALALRFPALAAKLVLYAMGGGALFVGSALSVVILAIVVKIRR